MRTNLRYRQFLDRGNLIDATVLLLCATGLLLALELRSFVFFRDYAITFEGAYRIFLGQMPYRDFGVPVGPISFLPPALFFKLLEPNATIFIYTQYIENIVLLFLIHALLRRIKVSPSTRRIAISVFAVFYLLLLSHPWYNSTAVLLLIASTYTSLHGPRVTSVALTGALVGLTILTKQDFGLLAALTSGLIIVIMSTGSDREHIITNIDSTSNALRFRKISINVSVFLICAATPVVLCMLLTDKTQFLYWFNYGQAPHEVRKIGIGAVLKNSYGALAGLSAIAAILYNNLRLLICSLFILTASVTRNTSGLEFTHYYHVAFLPVIIAEFIQLKVRWKRLMALALIYTSARLVTKPIVDVYHVVESVATNQPEHYFFDQRKNSRSMERFPPELAAFSTKMQAPQQTIGALQAIKKEVTALRARSNGREPRILNISELTPVYAELATPPPTGIPLWFHTGVTMFPQEIERIEQLLKSTEYDIILVQGAHGGLTDVFIEFLTTLKNNPSYTLVKNIDNSPANATWPCDTRCDGNIFIYQLNKKENPKNT